ncbi:MAG: asparagine synthase-related protein [Alphaproteobacteria bacterium]
MNSFTIGFEDNAFDEAPYAKEISKTLGTNHNEVYFNNTDINSLIGELPILYDEPFADSSQLTNNAIE